MGTYDTYATDKEREENGTWVTLSDGSRWLLARATSSRAQEARNKAQRPYRNLIRQNERLGRDLPQEVENEIALETVVQGVVLDWSGVTGPKGEKLNCTENNVRKVLKDLPDLQFEVLRESNDIENFQRIEQEEAEKNS